MQAVWQCLRSPWLPAVAMTVSQKSGGVSNSRLQGCLLDSDLLGWKEKGGASAQRKDILGITCCRRRVLATWRGG